MKITRATAHHLSYPVQRPFANSCVWNRARTAGVVELETDAGSTGWGEGSTAPGAEALAALIGADPFSAGSLGRRAQAAGCSPAAWSGVDIALHDLMGKATGRPVHQLLGGALREHVPCYASGLFLYEADDVTAGLAAEAAGYVGAGFGAVKMKIGFGPARDAARVRAVREAIGPDVRLAVDANCAYDAATALASVRRVAEYDILWYEEPVPPAEVAAYGEIRAAAPMPLAGGEALEGLRAFRGLVEKRSFDIVQPDISIAGGFSACRQVEALAEAHGVRVLPHMWGTAIRLAATLHWQAVIPDGPGLFPEPGLYEYDMTENGLRTQLAVEPLVQRDGVLAVPEAPGLGIDIDREILARWTVRRETVGA
jgi:D-galactarolactone cycloisomerase